MPVYSPVHQGSQVGGTVADHRTALTREEGNESMHAAHLTSFPHSYTI